MSTTMKTQTKTVHPWFTELKGTVVGQTFVGDRSRLHVADIVAVAPHSLQLQILCGAGSYGEVDVNTTVRNINLDGSSEADCKAWWQEKVLLVPNRTISQIIPGGLRRPRICNTCEQIREGDPAPE